MSIQVNTNSYEKIISPNYNNNTIRKNEINNPILEKTPDTDTFEISNKRVSNSAMIETMERKGTNLLGAKHTLEGTLNGETANLTVDGEGITIFSKTNVSGQIGDKNANLSYKMENLSNTNFQGKIGNDSFNLTIQKSGLIKKQTVITGEINGQKVSFNLNGGEVPENKDIQDILATILMLNGEEAKQKDGVFNGTKGSDWYQQDMLESMAMTASMNTASSPAMPPYQPTWHYENPMCPTFY